MRRKSGALRPARGLQLGRREVRRRRIHRL